MPRAYVLGNGNIFAAFDECLQLRDFHFPHVGMEDHTLDGHAHRIGFFADGWFAWINDRSWQIGYDYHNSALIGDSRAEHSFLRLSIRFEDFLLPRHDVLVRRLTITNQAEYAREIKIFFHHDFNISGDKTKDTAQYEPRLNALLHYRGYRYFLVNGRWDDDTGMAMFTTGKSNYNGKEGTFRDAEDGILSGNPIEQGSVDSTVGFVQRFEPHESKILTLYLIAGKTYGDVLRENETLLKKGSDLLFRQAEDFWRKQFRPAKNTAGLPEAVIDLYHTSIRVIRAHIDHGGAIIAANDSDIMRSNRDNYSYMWPRDGAFIAMALCEAGYPGPIKKFFQFCANALTKEGFLLSKYNADGSVGSSWHPKIVNGEIRSQIQEDETALVLVALRKYLATTNDLTFVSKLFSRLIAPAAKFLAGYIDEKSGLPKPSYDLWEQEWGHALYTSATVYEGMKAAAELADILKEKEFALSLHASAESIRDSILKTFWYAEDGRFASRVFIGNGESHEYGKRADMSSVFLWKCGLLPVDDARVKSTMEHLSRRLEIKSHIGGYARYEQDFYHFDAHLSHAHFPGNPWIITTLWKADYEIETAKNIVDLRNAINTFEWVLKRANSAGILPEQVHPLSGAPLAVAPLTWSHAAFVQSVLRYNIREKLLL